MDGGIRLIDGKLRWLSLRYLYEHRSRNLILNRSLRVWVESLDRLRVRVREVGGHAVLTFILLGILGCCFAVSCSNLSFSLFRGYINYCKGVM